MHYPWWYVPNLTAPMLIAIISVLHVLVSHYAVGGGLFLAVEVGKAYRTNDYEYLAYLKRHARFFILLTVVFGAISGVGIWWIIGLASPLATEVLIRTFVFGWATEWVFFVIELVAAFVFYYYWDRLPKKIHIIVGWIYAVAAWISLLLITGITGFMLNPDGWLGPWSPQQGFWGGFLNYQLLPQTIARTGGALLLSSLYVYLHASLTIREPRLQTVIARRSTRPALLGAILISLGGVGWYVWLPESAKLVLESAAALNILVAIIFAVTAAVFVLLYFGPYRNPGWLTPGFAIALFLFGTAAFSAGEFIREAVRKPYVVYQRVLGNQVLPEEIPGLRETGYLEGGVWTKKHVEVNYPRLIVDGKIDRRLLGLEPGAPGAVLSRDDQLALGQVIFQHHCNDCHAIEQGLSAAGPLVRGWSPPMIRSLVEHLHEAHFFMPPWSGTPEEAELLSKYLEAIAPPRPAEMFPELEALEAADEPR